jgi:glycosyltransferase involved in cell wall biosynthesis
LKRLPGHGKLAFVKKSDVCVLIPAYNEEKNISVLLSKILARGYPALVVDDGSLDGTAAAAKEAGAAEVLRLESNAGKGAATRRGIEWVLGRGYEAVIFMDADGQHDPAELDLFFDALNQGAQVVIGNRMRNPAGMPWLRRATNRFMSWLISLLAHQTIPDTQCGYRAMTKNVLEKMSFSTDRFEMDSEMLLEAARLGARMESVPVRSVYEGGKSRIHPLRDTARFFLFLFRYFSSKKV